MTLLLLARRQTELVAFSGSFYFADFVTAKFAEKPTFMLYYERVSRTKILSESGRIWKRASGSFRRIFVYMFIPLGLCKVYGNFKLGLNDQRSAINVSFGWSREMFRIRIFVFVFCTRVEKWDCGKLRGQEKYSFGKFYCNIARCYCRFRVKTTTGIFEPEGNYDFNSKQRISFQWYTNRRNLHY